ncbi:MAG TPA: hypothetical protein VHV10_14905 [Ktedonobacteraceae bacterium]|jgi:hypothetical protein|nr:hypothetical protein [Ktedonobacteraceae bacterium]
MDNQSTIPIDEPDEQPWLRQPDESNFWYARFSEYLALGPLRTKLAVYNAERARKGPKEPDNSKSLPTSWRDAAKRFDWIKRAESFDAWRRKEVFTYRNAQDTERVKKLDEIVELLHARVLAMLESAMADERFNEKLMAQYLSTLDLMAKHVGGYGPQRIEHTGKGGKPIEVEETKLNVFWYMPQIEPLPDSSDTQVEELPDDGDPDGQP